MAKYHKYRATFRDQSGAPFVISGKVHATTKETDQHIRGRITLDVMAKLELAWATIEEGANANPVAA